MKKKGSKDAKQPWVLVVIVIFVLAMLAIAAYVTFDVMNKKAEKAAQQSTSKIQSFQDCVDAGNPIQMSYPEVCVTADGESFTNSTN